MAKNRHKRADRDGVRFLALPHTVLDAPAFLGLSAPAVRLLIDIARQYSGTNNGRLVCCAKYMEPRGWKSHDTITRARRQLEAAGLIVETRKGMRPNRAAWFAVTWAGLDWSPEMDMPRDGFERGLYCKNDPLPPILKTRALARLTG